MGKMEQRVESRLKQSCLRFTGAVLRYASQLIRDFYEKGY